jgi:hypothetical protein
MAHCGREAPIGCIEVTRSSRPDPAQETVETQRRGLNGHPRSVTRGVEDACGNGVTVTFASGVEVLRSRGGQKRDILVP